MGINHAISLIVYRCPPRRAYECFRHKPPAQVAVRSRPMSILVRFGNSAAGFASAASDNSNGYDASQPAGSGRFASIAEERPQGRMLVGSRDGAWIFPARPGPLRGSGRKARPAWPDGTTTPTAGRDAARGRVRRAFHRLRVRVGDEVALTEEAASSRSLGRMSAGRRRPLPAAGWPTSGRSSERVSIDQHSPKRPGVAAFRRSASKAVLTERGRDCYESSSGRGLGLHPERSLVGRSRREPGVGGNSLSMTMSRAKGVRRILSDAGRSPGQLCHQPWTRQDDHRNRDLRLTFV
jgi:hypothetical protein